MLGVQTGPSGSKTGADELRRMAGGVNGGSGDLAMGAGSWKCAYKHQ